MTALSVILIAGCTAPTSNTTPSPSASTTASGDLATTLNTQISAHYQLIDNFTRISEGDESPVYTGTFQEQNGTVHSVTLYVANSTEEAQQQFEAQKMAYAPAQEVGATAPAAGETAPTEEGVTAPNATVTVNTTTHWEATVDSTTVGVWLGEPNTAGPFGVQLDVPYVLVSQDFRESAVETAEAT